MFSGVTRPSSNYSVKGTECAEGKETQFTDTIERLHMNGRGPTKGATPKAVHISYVQRRALCTCIKHCF
jgi:hypothetical protein